MRNFEHCSLQPKFKPIWSPSQRGRWAAPPLLGFYLKNCAISKQTFHINLSASRCGWSHPGHRLFKKIQSRCFSRNQPNTICLFSSGPARQFFCLQRPRPPRLFCLARHLVQNPEVKSSSFSFRENQSLLDSPPLL
jgi:hypothetical protein